MVNEISVGPGFILTVGIGIFLIACSILSSSAGSIDNRRLKAAFAGLRRRSSGVWIGTLFTAIIQSSASTVILVIGFVNAGVMSLGMAATVIYGANIGTTATAQIVALGVTSGFAPLFSVVTCVAGLALLVVQKDIHRAIAGVSVGVGMMFSGIHLISISIREFSEYIVPFISGMNFVMLIVLGIIITAVVQSSSVTTSLVITAMTCGLIKLGQGIYVALGSNIGSCLVVLLAGMNGSLNARRASLIHFFFNVTGVLAFIVIDAAFFGSISGMFEYIPGAFGLAMFHTAFKVATTSLVYPFTDLLIHVVTKLTPYREENVKPHFHFIDVLMLKNPPIAVQQLKSEVINMSEIAISNFKTSVEIIRNMDFSEVAQFMKNEDELNCLNRDISRFLVKLNKTDLSKRDRMYVSSVYHTVIDLERVGDYAENIVEYAQGMRARDYKFPDFVGDEIIGVRDLVCDLYDKVMRAYSKMDKSDLREAFDIEEKINVVTSNMKSSHVQRLDDGSCVFSASVEYLLLASDMERVADHFMNVGKAAKQKS
ncbi:MAG: Na/Pi symporter [archaeon]|nr:Na/Pi symporter [archaeon]